MASFWMRGERHRLNRNLRNCHQDDFGGQGDKKAKIGPVWAEMIPAGLGHSTVNLAQARQAAVRDRQKDVCRDKHVPVHSKSNPSPCTRGSQLLRTLISHFCL